MPWTLLSSAQFLALERSSSSWILSSRFKKIIKPLGPAYYSTLSQNEKESTWANVKRLNPARRSRLAEHVVYTDSVVDALCAETLALLSGSYNARLADEDCFVRS